jgi:hypothetical protein
MVKTERSTLFRLAHEHLNRKKSSITYLAVKWTLATAESCKLQGYELRRASQLDSKPTFRAFPLGLALFAVFRFVERSGD